MKAKGEDRRKVEEKPATSIFEKPISKPSSKASKLNILDLPSAAAKRKARECLLEEGRDVGLGNQIGTPSIRV